MILLARIRTPEHVGQIPRCVIIHGTEAHSKPQPCDEDQHVYRSTTCHCCELATHSMPIEESTLAGYSQIVVVIERLDLLLKDL
jgi:hypothetical protein